MRGRWGSGTGVLGTTTTTTGAATTTTTWDRCCRCCGVAVATAAIRRWTPTVFGYAMLVSLLAAHLLPPVWASRPTPPPSPRAPLPGAPTPPRDAGGGRDNSGGRGGARQRSSHNTNNGHNKHNGKGGSPGSSGSAYTHSRVTDISHSIASSSHQGQCHGWGVHLQRLLLRRSSGSHPHRQHSSSPYRHYQHYPAPAPSLTSLASPYSFSPPSSFPSSFSALSPSSTSSQHDSNNHRGLPEAPLQVVIHQQEHHQPHSQHHQQQPQPPPQPHPQRLQVQLDSSRATQRRDIRVGVQEGEQERPGQEEGKGEGQTELKEKCQETENQDKELPGLCNCTSSCRPFSHADPDNRDSARCLRSTLTDWMVCQVCSCKSRHRRLRAFMSTQLPFCSQTPVNYLLPCSPSAFSSSPLPPESPSPRAGGDDVTDSDDDDEGDPSCNESCDGGGEVANEESGCMCSKRDCVHRLHELLRLDSVAEQRFKEFKGLLGRYDCNSKYSVKWGCSQCEEAYKQWLCASTLTYFFEGVRVLPCSSFCQEVEAMCPFFRPKVDTHEGDPSFICKDPEIEAGPSNGAQNGTPSCFQLCHVMGKEDISQTFCPSNESRCHHLRELHQECPPLSLGDLTQTDNSTGSHANATSAATGSVHSFSGHVTRTMASSVVVLGASVVIGSGADPGVVGVILATLLSLLWMALTSYPYSCIGLT